jgi:hypothetical protein
VKPAPPPSAAHVYVARRTELHAETPDGLLVGYVLAGVQAIAREATPDGRFTLVDFPVRGVDPERHIVGWVATADLTAGSIAPHTPGDPWDVESDPSRVRFLSEVLWTDPASNNLYRVGRVRCASGRIVEHTQRGAHAFTRVAIDESYKFERVGWVLGSLWPTYPGNPDCTRVLRMPDPPNGNPPRIAIPDEWVTVRDGDAASALKRAESILTAGKTLHWLTTESTKCEPWTVRKPRDPGYRVTISGTVRGLDGRPTHGDVDVMVVNGGIGIEGLGPGSVDRLTPVSERAGGVALVWPEGPDEPSGAVFAFHPSSVNMWFDDARACEREAAARGR